MIVKFLDKFGKLVKSITSIGYLPVDVEPVKDSKHLLASGAVAEIVPEGASKDNPLMTAEDTERMIDTMKPIDAMTLRFEFSKKDYSPVVAGVGFIEGKEEYCTWTKVPSPTLNVWDWKYWDGETNEWDWDYVFKDAFTDQDNEVSIIAAGDLSNVYGTFGMFQSSELEPNNIVSCCDLSFPGSLVALYMFYNTNLKKAPNLSFEDGANVSSIFARCTRLEELGKLEGALSGCQSSFDFAKNVKYGMLEMYERLSNQDPAITQHGFCFTDCGIDTEEGRAALAQIPQSWGGLAEG